MIKGFSFVVVVYDVSLEGASNWLRGVQFRGPCTMMKCSRGLQLYRIMPVQLLKAVLYSQKCHCEYVFAWIRHREVST